MSRDSVQLTLQGNLAEDPELRFTKAGQAVCSFRVITSRRIKDKQTGEWSDTDTTGWRCTAWGQLAENVAESVTKGTAMVVVGRASERSYETREGETRRTMEVTADAVAVDLRRATAKVTRTSRVTTDHGSADDPWAVPAAPAGGDDEPPF